MLSRTGHRQDEHGGRDGEQERLAGERLHRRERDLSLEQAVRAPGGGEHEGDDRRPPVGDRQHHDGQRGERDRQLLQPRGVLVEHGDAEDHRDERGHEVAERGLDDPVVGDRPHVGRPVRCQQHRGDGQSTDEASVAQGGEQHGPAPALRDDRREDDGGAEDPPADQLDRIEVAEPLPVDREEAPEDVGGDRRPHAGPGLVIHERRRYGRRRTIGV